MCILPFSEENGLNFTWIIQARLRNDIAGIFVIIPFIYYYSPYGDCARDNRRIEDDIPNFIPTKKISQFQSRSTILNCMKFVDRRMFEALLLFFFGQDLISTHSFPSIPTEYFTVLKPQNPPIIISKQHKILRSTDLLAQKLRNIPSCRRSTINWYFILLYLHIYSSHLQLSKIWGLAEDSNEGEEKNEER